MTIVERHAIEMLRAVRFAVRRHRSVRRAAAYVGMSKSGFHDYCRAHGISHAGASAPKRNRP